MNIRSNIVSSEVTAQYVGYSIRPRLVLTNTGIFKVTTELF